MGNNLVIKFNSVTIDCVNTEELGKFYADLMGWIVVYSGEEYTVIAPPDVAQCGYPGITFQNNPDYLPPVWPEKPGEQQQMTHLDFAVNDVAAAVERAISLGARRAERQFSEGWTVMLDPAGHPFCLCDMKHLIDGAGFALK